MRSISWFLSVLCLLFSCMVTDVAFCDNNNAHDSKIPGKSDKLVYSFESGIERWDGFTEYEIDVGTIVYGPTRESVNAGSRLRFPVNSILMRFGGSVEFRSFTLGIGMRIQISNDEDTFKDYDFYVRGGKQSAFWFGTASNDDYSKELDFDLSHKFTVGDFNLTPRIRFSYVQMRFDENGIHQTDYYDIDRNTGYLEPHNEPKVYINDAAHTLKYKIDHKILYFGGTVSYTTPIKLQGGLTALLTPLCWAKDLDNHLLRDKDSWSFTSGSGGLFELHLAYRFCRFVKASANVSYRFVNTSGKQSQQGPDSETGKIVLYTTSIPITTKTEWMSIGAIVTIDIGRLLQ